MDAFKTPTIGLLLASGIAAGFLAYAFSYRRTQEEKMAWTRQQAVMERAKEFGDSEVARAGREFVSEKLVPEMKPILIDLLKEFEHYLDRYFKKAEKAIQTM